MSVKKKIENGIEKLEKNEAFKELMLQILEEESKGLHSFKAKYEELINNYINNNVGVQNYDQDWKNRI